MSRHSKRLYLADSVQALNKLVFSDSNKLNELPVRKCCRLADDCYRKASESLSDGDDERAYVLHMRYMELISAIRSKPEYARDSRFYDSLMGVKKFKLAVDLCEKLQEQLTKRYKLRLEQQETDRGLEQRKSGVQTHSPGAKSVSKARADGARTKDMANRAEEMVSTEKSSQLASETEINCSELYSLLQQKCSSMLIIDIRPEEDFSASHLTLGHVISVPAHLLTPGVTPAALEQSLSSEFSQQQFARRANFDQLVVFDWSGAGQQLHVLSSALRRWDVNTTYRDGLRLRVLTGGYRMWLHAYPMLTTDPHVQPPSITSSSTSSSAPLSHVKYPSLHPVSPPPQPPPTLESGQVPSSASLHSNVLAHGFTGTPRSTVSFPGSTDTPSSTDSVPGSATSTRSVVSIPAPGVPSRNLKPALKPSASSDVNSSNTKATHAAADLQPGTDGLVKDLSDLKIEDARWHNEHRKLRDENEELKAQLLAFKKGSSVSTDSSSIENKAVLSSSTPTISSSQQPSNVRDHPPAPNLVRDSSHSADQRGDSRTSTVPEWTNIDRSGKTPGTGGNLSDKQLNDIHNATPRSSAPTTTVTFPSPSVSSAVSSVSAVGGMRVPCSQSSTASSETRIAPHPSPGSTTTDPKIRSSSDISARNPRESETNKTTAARKNVVKPSEKTSLSSGRNPDGNSATSDRGTLKRSNSSPYIDRTGLADDRAVAPSYNRENKPVARNWAPDQRPVRARFFSPVFGTARSALTGLKNLGNTCYMNAVIQCVNNTPGLSDFFVKERHQDFINFDNDKSGGMVVEEIAEVIKLMWSGHYRSISMHDMKDVIGKLHQPFSGTSQHDAHEFLMYLLEYLHEDLNEVKRKVPLKEQENDGVPEAKAARVFWDDFTRNNRSFILNMFYGQLKSTVQCNQCHSKSIKFEAFSHLSVPMPDKQRLSRCTLQECIRLYLSGETIDGWRCSRCKSHVQAVKTLDIWNLPPILVIHLQRFYNDGLWRKKQSAVDFPLTRLDLSEYVINMQSRYRCSEFKLYGVVNHYGSMERGHYTAFCCHPLLSRWHKFDDHEVGEITPSAVHTSAGYILFYSAIDSSL